MKFWEHKNFPIYGIMHVHVHTCAICTMPYPTRLTTSSLLLLFLFSTLSTGSGKGEGKGKSHLSHSLFGSASHEDSGSLFSPKDEEVRSAPSLSHPYPSTPHMYTYMYAPPSPLLPPFPPLPFLLPQPPPLKAPSKRKPQVDDLFGEGEEEEEGDIFPGVSSKPAKVLSIS